MTPEELDEARAREAVRIWGSQPLASGDISAPAAIAARLAREGWTPPEPVDSDILAFREFASKEARSASLAEAYRDGDMDSGASARLFLAGARMAREQERERADMPIRMAEELVGRLRSLLHSLPLQVRAQLGVKWDLDEAFANAARSEIEKYARALLKESDL